MDLPVSPPAPSSTRQVKEDELALSAIMFPIDTTITVEIRSNGTIKTKLCIIM